MKIIISTVTLICLGCLSWYVVGNDMEHFDCVLRGLPNCSFQGWQDYDHYSVDKNYWLWQIVASGSLVLDHISNIVIFG